MLVDNKDVDDLQDCLDGDAITLDEYAALQDCANRAEQHFTYLDKDSMHYLSCITPQNDKQRENLRRETSTNPEDWILETDFGEDNIFSNHQDALAYIEKQYENVDHDDLNFDPNNTNADDKQCYDAYGRSHDVLEDVDMCVFVQMDFDDHAGSGHMAHTYAPRRTPDFLQILTTMPKQVGFTIDEHMKEDFFARGDDGTVDVTKNETCYGRADIKNRVIICLHKPLAKAFNYKSPYICINGGSSMPHKMSYNQGKTITTLQGSALFAGKWLSVPALSKYIDFSAKCYSVFNLTYTLPNHWDPSLLAVQLEFKVYSDTDFECRGMPIDTDAEHIVENFVAKSRKEMGKACPEDKQIDTMLSYCLSGRSKNFHATLVHSLEAIGTAEVFKKCTFKSNIPNGCAFFYYNNGAYGVPDWNALTQAASVVNAPYIQDDYTCYFFFFVSEDLKSFLSKNPCYAKIIAPDENELMACTCTTANCDKKVDKHIDIYGKFIKEYVCYFTDVGGAVEVEPAHYHVCGALYSPSDDKYYYASLGFVLQFVNVDHALCMLDSDRYATGYSMCQTVKGAFSGTFCCCKAGPYPCNDETNFKAYVTMPKNPFPGCFIDDLKDVRCKESKHVRSYKYFMCRSERIGFGELVKVEHGCELHDRRPRNRREVICSGPLAAILRRSDEQCYTVAIEAFDEGPPGYDIVLCCHPSDFRNNGNKLAQRNFTTFDAYA
uniref:SCP domain-containing protein n=1 Tax=Panagrellus redivivus TaxID=6233 RepID=A0A7E4VK32_PANRE